MPAFQASHRPVRLFQPWGRAKRTRGHTFMGRMFMDMVAERVNVRNTRCLQSDRFTRHSMLKRGQGGT